MDLSTATPVEIDTVLADLYDKQWDAQAEAARQISFAQEIEDGIAKFQTGEARYRRYSGWTQEQADECRAKAAVFYDKVADLDEQMAPYEAEFAKRRWSRFYVVQGGHIHSSMACSTCNKNGKATRFGWIPERSGQSEEQALESLVTESAKTVLCSVCFPSAPVAWTVPRQDGCPGSNTYDYDRATARQGYYTGNYGVCNHCGEKVTTTSTGKMRKHKKA